LFFKNERSSSSYTTGLLKQLAKINVFRLFSDEALGFIEHGLLEQEFAFPQLQNKKRQGKREKHCPVASAKACSCYSYWLLT